MNSKSTYLKVEADILRGRKEKATLRLKSMINNNPDNLEIRETLAQLYYDSGFYDSAGKYWILKETDEEHIRKCVETYVASVKNSGHQILMDLKFYGDKSLLPLYSQKVLNDLEEDSFAKMKHIPTFTRKIKAKVEPKAKPTLVDSIKEDLIKFGCVAIGIFVLLSVIVGVTTIYNYFF